MIIAKSLILASQCCLLFSAAPVVADRDVGPQEYNYFQRLRNKRSKKHQTKKYSQENDGSALAKITTPQRGPRASLLYRSFLLAAFFWTIKFLGPVIIRWASQLWKDISEFKRYASRVKEMRRRKKKKKSHSDGATSVANETTSISPSVMEIIDLGDSTDDDATSTISSGTTISSMATFLTSFTKPRRRSNTSSVAVSPGRFVSSTHPTRRLKSRSSKSKPSKSPKRQTYSDEECGNTDSELRSSLRSSWRSSLPKFLRFIDEDTADKKGQNTSDSKQHRYKKNHKSEWLDDVSHVPAAGNDEVDHGYNPKSKSRKSGSQLDRKLSTGVESSRNPERRTNGHSSKKNTRQEKRTSSKSHHQGQHRHRDRKK